MLLVILEPIVPFVQKEHLKWNLDLVNAYPVVTRRPQKEKGKQIMKSAVRITHYSSESCSFVFISKPDNRPLSILFITTGICNQGFGGNDCAPCAIGTYKDKTGSDECSPCSNDPGYTTSQEGSKSQDECK